MRHLKSKSRETTQRHPLGPVPVQSGVIPLQIREEKPETTYLDALHLEVEGVPIRPQAGLLRDVDGQYLVLQQGDSFELSFDVSTLAGSRAAVEVVIVSTGYYDIEF